MNIAFVSLEDARDVHSWGGTPYFMSTSLAARVARLDYISPLREIWSPYFKAKQVIRQALFPRRYVRHREPAILRGYSRQVAAQLSGLDSDVVFSTGTMPIAHLECRQPVAFWTDATFAAMLEFYPTFTGLSADAIQHGHAHEQLALDKAALAIFTSDWAARTTIEHYRIDPARVKVVPYGANMQTTPDAVQVEELILRRPVDKCNLLFLAVDWLRKGGDIALELARMLNDAGLPTQLTIAGCRPEQGEPLPPFVRDAGFVSKSSPQGERRLAELMGESHFLVLPTRADCSPNVLREANAFGVPCLTSDVGGIPTVIRDGRNGWTIPINTGAATYCQYISKAFEDSAAYRKLAISSFHEYQTRLNWNVAAQTVVRLLEGLTAKT